jgi:hypothetical protein
MNRRFRPPTVTLHIGGKIYRIFAHSYLSYGEAEARKTYFKKLVIRAIRTRRANKRIVYSPCHNYGFIKSVKVYGKSFVIRGMYRGPRLCRRLISWFFFCKTCAFKRQPRLTGRFYTTSLFDYAFKGTGVVKEDGERVTLDKINKVSDSFCSKSANQLDTKKDFLAQARCFHLNYIDVMLVKGYKVHRRSFSMYNARKLNGFDLNWTLGAVLMTNKFI